MTRIRRRPNFKVKSETTAKKVETLTFNIIDLSNDNKTAKVQMAWENTSVNSRLVLTSMKKVMSFY